MNHLFLNELVYLNMNNRFRSKNTCENNAQLINIVVEITNNVSRTRPTCLFHVDRQKWP